MNDHAEASRMALLHITRERLARVGTACIANVLLARGFRNVYLLGLKPLVAGLPNMVGTAYTLRFIPAREDVDHLTNYASSDNLHRRAVEECPADSVLVIDAMGQCRSASGGDLMVSRLKARGVAGIVTDGGFRDTPAIGRLGLPAYQRESAPPATPIAMHPQALNEPIGCAGVAIYPGDIIVGDAEGVVAIPRALVDEVAQEALAATEYENYADVQVARGRSLYGLFPSTEESRAEYLAWVEQGRPHY